MARRGFAPRTRKRQYLVNGREATRETIEAVASKYQETYTNSASKWDDQLEMAYARFSKEALQDRDVPERPKFGPRKDPFFAAATFNGGPMDLPDSERVATCRSEWQACRIPAGSTRAGQRRRARHPWNSTSSCAATITIPASRWTNSSPVVAGSSRRSVEKKGAVASNSRNG